MENRFKLKISRIFRDSFISCRSRNLTDIIENAVFLPENHLNVQLIEPFYPKIRSFPSICKPRCPNSTQIINQSKEIVPRQKISERNSAFRNIHGRMCPPASPVSPINPYSVFHEFDSKPKPQRSKKLNKKKKKSEVFPFSSSSHETNFSDTDAFFSSKSRSSDSSISRRKPRRRSRRRKAPVENSEMGMLEIDGKVKGSVAIVKKSSDPYNDFRTSMLEMIVEKQIFSGKDLENLLQCFLSLNSDDHHRIIVEVFLEIWDALFSDFS